MFSRLNLDPANRMLDMAGPGRQIIETRFHPVKLTSNQSQVLKDQIIRGIHRTDTFRRLPNQTLLALLDLFYPSHIGPQGLRDCDGTILVLIIFEDGDQRAANRDARSVERVDEARGLSPLGTIARVHP